MCVSSGSNPGFNSSPRLGSALHYRAILPGNSTILTHAHRVDLQLSHLGGPSFSSGMQASQLRALAPEASGVENPRSHDAFRRAEVLTSEIRSLSKLGHHRHFPPSWINQCSSIPISVFGSDELPPATKLDASNPDVAGNFLPLR